MQLVCSESGSPPGSHFTEHTGNTVITEHLYPTGSQIGVRFDRVPADYLVRVSRWPHRAYGAGQTENDPFWGMLSFWAGQGTIVWVTREASRTRPAVRSVV